MEGDAVSYNVYQDPVFWALAIPCWTIAMVTATIAIKNVVWLWRNRKK